MKETSVLTTMASSLIQTVRTIGVGVAMMCALTVHAWPDKPVRIVVGFAPGGAPDAAARVIAEQLQKKYGQAFTVDNRAGAGGRLATDNVAKSDPDGHVIGILVGGDTVVAASDPKLPYNLQRDFQFVTTLSVYPFVVVAGPDSKVKSTKTIDFDNIVSIIILK